MQNGHQKVSKNETDPTWKRRKIGVNSSQYQLRLSLVCLNLSKYYWYRAEKGRRALQYSSTEEGRYERDNSDFRFSIIIRVSPQFKRTLAKILWRKKPLLEVKNEIQ